MIWLLLACHNDTADPNETFFPPDERGPLAISTNEKTMLHSEGFEVPIQVWYPTEEADDELYVYDGLISGTASERGTPLCDVKRDVVLFSHGNQGLRYQSYFLTEYLATHGYIVVAPRHVDNSIFDYAASAMPEMVFRRPRDIIESFDWVQGYEPLQDCLDEGKGYAVIGHSFGGYTTTALSGALVDTDQSREYCHDNGGWLCDEVDSYASEHGSGVYDLSDGRIWAGIPLAPAGYEALVGGLEQVTIPMLVIGGELDSSTTMAEQVVPIHSGMRNSEALLAEILGADHYTFTDACGILPGSGYCSEGALDITEAHELIQTMVVAFLGQAQGIERMAEYLPPESVHVSWTD